MKASYQIRNFIGKNEPWLFSQIKKIDNSYTTFKIPKKKKGEYRIIEAPNKELKKIQTKFKNLLTDLYQEKANFDFVGSTGTERRTSIVSNAQFHINKKHILNIDIANFYNSIHLKTVNSFFSKNELNLDERERLYLLNLLTYKKHLPQGAPSSPIIANLICISMDTELHFLAKRNNLTYSRYVDDMTFSSDRFIEVETLQKIEKIMNAYKFKLNSRKTRFTNSNHQQTVTGLVVNKHVNINRKKYKHVRAIVNDICNSGVAIAYMKYNKGIVHKRQIELSQFLDYVQGYVRFIGQVLGKESMRYIYLSPVLSYNNNGESNNPRIHDSC